MKVFRKRRPVEDDEVDPEVDDVSGGEDADSTDAPSAPVDETPRRPVERPQGPWDVEDAPADELLDLGGMRVPVVENFDISITAEGDIPVVVTYGAPDGVMQLHAFAAPRTTGIWVDVSVEIADSLTEAGGQSAPSTGPFGHELRATIPVQAPDGSTVLQPARFIGIDGPRWFLRALFTGPAIEDPVRAKEFEDIIRRVVVVRGHEAMAPRDVIPLRLPADADQLGGGPTDDDQSEPDAHDEQPSPLHMPERGPEITEVR